MAKKKVSRDDLAAEFMCEFVGVMAEMFEKNIKDMLDEAPILEVANRIGIDINDIDFVSCKLKS